MNHARARQIGAGLAELAERLRTAETRGREQAKRNVLGSDMPPAEIAFFVETYTASFVSGEITEIASDLADVAKAMGHR